MADTIRKMLDITGTMFKDDQAAKSLTPQRFRDVMETMKTQFAFYKFSAGAFTTGTTGTYKSLDNTGAIVLANGFSEASDGVIQYDTVPVDSVNSSNQPRSFLAVAVANVEPLTGAFESEYAFAVDGTPDTNSVQNVELTTLLEPQQVVLVSVLQNLTSGQQVTFEVKNIDNTNNLTVNNCIILLIGLND